MRDRLGVISVLLTAIAMAGGLAHLLAFVNKIGLSREHYLIVQQIYRGWALLGIAVVGALASTSTYAVLLRGRGTPFYLAVAAAGCIALSLAVFFTFTFPANRQRATGPCCRTTGRSCAGAGSPRTWPARSSISSRSCSSQSPWSQDEAATGDRHC